MAKVGLKNSSENEPLNKKLKTIKLDDEKKSKKSDRSKGDKPDQPKETPVKIDKSAKLKPTGQPKSDDLKAKRQLKRQKKKLERLNKKNQANKKAKKPAQNDDQEPQEKNKKNLHLNREQKLVSIFDQQNENNRTIINHYKNLVAKVLASGSQVHDILKQIKQLILDVNLDKELRNYLINDLNRFVATLIHQQNQTKEPSGSRQETDETLLTLLKFVALNSFFSTRPDENVAKNIGPDTVGCFRSCFVKSIVLIVRNSTNKKRKEIERPRLDLLYQIMKHVYSLMNGDESNELKEDFNQIFKKISNSHKQIQLKEKQEQSTLAAFFLFFVFLGVNVFDERANCMQILDEVTECFKRFTNKTPDDPQWADVLTDIILSLLSTASNLKRAVCDEVFGLISKEITKAGLEQLMIALISDNVEIDDEEMLDEDEEASENEDQQESGKESQDESGNAEESDEEAEEELEGEEEDETNDLEVDAECAEEFTSKDDEESSGDESDDDGSDTESIDDEFRNRIKAALGKAAASEEDEEDEIVFDDEQMFKFDEAIAKVFQEKKKLKHKDQELVEFKSRCFDLVQILLNRKDLDPSFLIEISKATLEVLSANNTSKSFDLILKASATLKRYQTIEHSKVIDDQLNEPLEKALALVGKLPEKVRGNLNCFIVWLLDQEPTAIEPILSDLEAKLKRTLDVSLLIQLAERKKRLAEIILGRLMLIDLKKKNKNTELQSFFKLMSACCLNAEQSDASKSSAKSLLTSSLDILNAKRKDKKARVLVDELVRFLTVFIKQHVQLVKADSELAGRLTQLGEQQAALKLSKKLRQKWKATLKTVN